MQTGLTTWWWVRGHGLITAFHDPPATSIFCHLADLDALGE
jgi:hypothetical protein